jgi:transcriptional regulator with XRE-family HTH domain
MPPHAVDVHVGTRLRQRRTLLGMSQTKLGGSVDLTFQQIQKYERGANRMGSSRLFEFAKVLDVPVSYFFDEMPASTQAARPIRGRGRNGSGERGFGESGTPFEREGDPLIRRETLELVRAYYKIRAVGVRGGVAKMIKALAAAEPAPALKKKRKAQLRAR